MKHVLVLRRSQLELTQQEVADAIPMSSRHYQRIETGTQKPLAGCVVRIARVLECPRIAESYCDECEIRIYRLAA